MKAVSSVVQLVEWWVDSMESWSAFLRVKHLVARSVGLMAADLVYLKAATMEWKHCQLRTWTP